MQLSSVEGVSLLSIESGALCNGTCPKGRSGELEEASSHPLKAVKLDIVSENKVWEVVAGLVCIISDAGA